MDNTMRRNILSLLGLAALALILMLLLPAANLQANSVTHTVSIQPNTIVQDDFLGVGVNIIPVSFMEGTTQYGYEEAHWEKDKKRILALQPKVARVWFQIDWMEPTKGNYTWNSPKMLSFYKYLDILQAAGTEVEFNFGWKVGEDLQSWFSIPGVDPKISAPADLDAYAASASAVLNELINNRGYTNIKYLTFYNEPNGNWDFESPGDQQAYYATMVQKVSDKLTADGLRQLVDIWGPEETVASWTAYMSSNADAYFDAYSFHVYSQTYDGLSTSIADRTSHAGSKPVMMTEFGFAQDDMSGWDGGLANSVIKAANEGISAALVWQLNGVWLPDPYVGSDTNGNYALWDSMVVGTKPYKRYYETSLLTRYIPAHSSVVSVQTGSQDMRAAAFKTSGGDYTIVLEANEGSSKNITFDFNGVNVGKTFRKHVYKSDVSLEGNALIPEVSASFAAGTSFTDNSIDSDYQVIVYTTLPAATQVELTPLESTVRGGQTKQLSANVIDNSGGVTWSVIGSGNGSITSGGLYTAPQVTEEKLVAIKAVSINDPSSYGIAFVKVRPAVVSGQVDIPTFSLAYGKYPSAEAVTITTATPDAVIRYTTNGSTPTESSTLYTGPIFLNPGMTKLKAVAFKSGMTSSTEAYSLYRIADASSGPDGYQFCAYENGFDCSFTGTASVAYGADGLFHYETLTNGTACTTSVFGDPNPGEPKRCYFSFNIPDEPPVVTIFNAGFEKPGTATYLTGPITNGWTFNVRSGVQRNGSALGSATAPEGFQTAFMISRDGISGEISQSMNFKAGTYSLSFLMAERPGYGGRLPFDVYVDNSKIGTFQPSSASFTQHTTDSFTVTAGYHTIKFVGQDTTSETTAFLDKITIQTASPTSPPTAEIANAGFETPSVANYLKGPMTLGWIFNSRAGVQKNGGVFGAASAPEGVQTAFLQSINGNHGEISQAVDFDAGTYTLSFQAANRTNSGGTQSFDVFLDQTLIGSYTTTSGIFTAYTSDSFTASAGSHTIKFVGTSTTGDNISFIDDVTIKLAVSSNPPPAELANEGFELPSVANYLKGPMTHGWTFNSRAGVQKNGGAFGTTTVPEGEQTAFLQSVNGDHGEISQAVDFEAGTYTVAFQAARRTNSGGAQTFDVFFDQTLIGSYSPASGGFATYTTDSFTASAGSHTIKFVGTSLTGDNTAFIDAVTIQ